MGVGIQRALKLDFSLAAQRNNCHRRAISSSLGIQLGSSNGLNGMGCNGTGCFQCSQHLIIHLSENDLSNMSVFQLVVKNCTKSMIYWTAQFIVV